MSPSPSLLLILTVTLTLSFLPLLFQAQAQAQAQALTPTHQVLQTHGFPIGLIPTNILNHTINPTTGEFIAYLDDSCKLILPPDNYLATYSKTIKGKLVEGKIEGLSGIRVRAFYQWWGITGIKVSGENLVFEVGMVSAKYPAKNFVEVPDCEGKKKVASA